MKYKVLLLIIFVLILSLFLSCSDKNEEPFLVRLSGDITEEVKDVNLNELNLTPFSYLKDGEQIETEGYKLSDVLAEVTFIDPDSTVLVTASDNLGARIDISSSGLCYLVKDGEKVNMKAPSHPPVAGIKDIVCITVIAKNPIESGLKIVKDDCVEILSYGNSILSLYDQIAENTLNGNVAYKHTLKSDFKANELTGELNNILYFENFDIIKAAPEGRLVISEGKLCYEYGETIYHSLTGIVTGTDTVIYDAFSEMKESLDKGQKVMFILPDGLSYQQIEEYGDGLTVLGYNYIRAASVNPAISNVALATLITGASPYHTEITERGVKKPAESDIFDYAISKGKSVKYYEGNGNLVITNIDQIYSAPDENGFTDRGVYTKAEADKAENHDLMFVHFHGIDDINHDFSPISSEAEAKIIEIDGYIEDLIEGFQGKIIIVPDHGAVTFEDNEGNLYGQHGVFQSEDMYVPYYVMEIS